MLNAEASVSTRPIFAFDTHPLVVPVPPHLRRSVETDAEEESAREDGADAV